MKTHREILDAVMQVRTSPAEGLTETPQADSLSRALHGSLVLALTLASLGVSARVMAGGDSGQHATTLQQTSSASLEMSLTGPGYVPNTPWMY